MFNSRELIGMELSRAKLCLEKQGIPYSVVYSQTNPSADTQLVVKVGEQCTLYVYGFMLNAAL